MTKELEEDEEETSHQHTSLDPADELSKMAENKIFHTKCSKSSQSWKETRRRGAPLPPSNSKRQKKQKESRTNGWRAKADAENTRENPKNNFSLRKPKSEVGNGNRKRERNFVMNLQLAFFESGGRHNVTSVMCHQSIKAVYCHLLACTHHLPPRLLSSSSSSSSTLFPDFSPPSSSSSSSQTTPLRHQSIQWQSKLHNPRTHNSPNFTKTTSNTNLATTSGSRSNHPIGHSLKGR